MLQCINAAFAIAEMSIYSSVTLVHYVAVSNHNIRGVFA